MLRVKRDAQYHYISNKGRILFLDAETTSLIGKLIKNKDGVIADGNLLNVFKFPLGFRKAARDIMSIKLGKKSSVKSYGLLFSKDIFFMATIEREPLVDSGKIIGVVHKVDAGIDQFSTNECFLNIGSICYNNERFSSTDLKILFLLAQFENIKAKEISTIIDVKMRTAYMYKYDLLNKLRDTFGYDDDVDYNDCLNKLFHVKVCEGGHATVLPAEELGQYYKKLSKRRMQKDILPCENNFKFLDDSDPSYLSNIIVANKKVNIDN
ncbi:hypothetical protein [Piscirickettsia litoralis]|uniref:HTH luxR-type domain-containing protein n=1 Tax=Piscirickettsia litoralis TaxID=1891921 RepID=A0ABX3A1Z4_9GAMM|nr:hypothetical protein [Piscirickettsia litoralis]ODN42468.1 hypothetical protein BGC07_05415 [Piscirickettsia litoralis]